MGLGLKHCVLLLKHKQLADQSYDPTVKVVTVHLNFLVNRGTAK